MPNLCRSGVTDTCRGALLAMACADPMKQLLAAKRMLEVGGRAGWMRGVEGCRAGAAPGWLAAVATGRRRSSCNLLSTPPSLWRSPSPTTCRALRTRPPQAYVSLEMPSQLAALHINASPAAPRLAVPPLLAALRGAQASAAGAQAALREFCSLPHLDLSSDDTILQLLSERLQGPALAPGGGLDRCQAACCGDAGGGACFVPGAALRHCITPPLGALPRAGSLKMALPERRKRGKPNAPLEQLQGLLQRCRPHQQRERHVLSCVVQVRATGCGRAALGCGPLNR